MWRMMPQPALATATTALMATALTLLASPATVQADAITPTYQYTSGGGIPNGSGSHSLSLAANTYVNSLSFPGTFNLGTFTTNPLLPGETDTYVNTPFHLDLKVAPAGTTINWVGDFYSAPGVADYQITGLLNGSIRSDGTSTLMPTIQSVTTAVGSPFPAADLNFTLPLIVAPSGSNPGVTTLTASVAVDGAGNPLPAPAPEPATVVIFAATLAGWAWNRRRSGSRVVVAATDSTC